MAAPEGKRNRIDKAYIGTMGWSYRFWVGPLYPSGTRPSAYLNEYAKRFNSVELDSTFYRIPSANTVRAWKEQAPEDFLFSAKFPRMITHVKMLRDCQREVDTFISRMSNLQNKLGPLLLQFPSSFGPKNLPILHEFLQTLPRDYRYAVEVRNRSMLGEELYSALRKNGVALVLTHQPALERGVTTDFTYIRWEGDRTKVNGTLGKTEVDRTEDIEKWATMLKELLNHQVRVFGYFSKYYSGYPPNDAEQLLKLLHSYRSS